MSHMRTIPGEYCWNHIAELVNACELIIIDLYYFFQEHICAAKFSCQEDLHQVLSQAAGLMSLKAGIFKSPYFLILCYSAP